MSNIQYLSYNPLSEEELLRIAQTRVAPGYDEQMAIYQQQTDKGAARYQQQMEKLEPEYERLLSGLSGQYEQKRQTLSDAATARGFGRSSYTTDLLARSYDQQTEGIAELMRQKSEEASKLQMQIDDLYDNLLTNQARLTTSKQNQILSQIDSLRQEQTARELEVMKYNADLNMREQQLALQREQLAAQQAQWQAQMAYNQQKAAQENAYKQQQMDFQKEQFTYKQQQDAAAALAAEYAAQMAAQAKSSGGKSGSSGGKSAASSGAPTFYGVRI